MKQLYSCFYCRYPTNYSSETSRHLMRKHDAAGLSLTEQMGLRAIVSQLQRAQRLWGLLSPAKFSLF